MDTIVFGETKDMIKTAEWLSELGDKVKLNKGEQIAVSMVPQTFPYVFDMPYMEYDVMEMAMMLEEYHAVATWYFDNYKGGDDIV
jgi:hypothetical protein